MDLCFEVAVFVVPRVASNLLCEEIISRLATVQNLGRKKLAFNNLIINTFFTRNNNIKFIRTFLKSLWSFLYSSVSV